MQQSITCSVCGYEMKLHEGVTDGEVVVCPKCGVELRLSIEDDEVFVDVV